MNLSSLVWSAILVIQLALQALARAKSDRTGLSIRKDQRLSNKVIAPAERVPVVKKRSAINGQDVVGRAGVRLSNREGSRQDVGVQNIQRLLKNKSQHSIHHLRGHGTFNTDMHSCDVMLSRSCRKPSECDGCLGLFTCKMPQGKCDFKGVSRRTAPFYRLWSS